MSMKATRRRVGMTLSLGLALAVSAALASQARPARAAATPISSCPFSITAPGLYEVTTDLSNCSDGIAISANNVQLRFGGHTLSGVQALGSNGLRTTRGVSNQLVDGPGTIQQFDDNVSLLQLSNSQMQGITVRNARVNGLDAPANQGNRFAQPVLTDNPNYGFNINGHNNEVANSSSTNNGRSGFQLSSVPSDPSTGNRFRNNTANGNHEAGIKVLATATENTFTGNTAQGNSPVDLQDDNLPNCVNKWSGNTFATDNEGDGPNAGCIR